MDSIIDINSMLIECVKAIGKYEAEKNGLVDEKRRRVGSKFVADKLWADKDIKAAQTLLLNCLNDSRPEKLTPDQAFLIEKMARDRGCHIAMEFRSEEMSYQPPVAVEPADPADQLMRDFIDAQKAITVISEQMKKRGLI